MRNKRLATGSRLLHLHVSGERYGLRHYPHGPGIVSGVFSANENPWNGMALYFHLSRFQFCVMNHRACEATVPPMCRIIKVSISLRIGYLILAVASSSPFNRSCPQKKTAAQDEGSSKIGLTCGLLSQSPSVGRMVTCYPFFSYPHKEAA